MRLRRLLEQALKRSRTCFNLSTSKLLSEDATSKSPATPQEGTGRPGERETGSVNETPVAPSPCPHFSHSVKSFKAALWSELSCRSQRGRSNCRRSSASVG